MCFFGGFRALGPKVWGFGFRGGGSEFRGVGGLVGFRALGV